MAFGGFGGFGQQAQQNQQGTGFGGFGASTNNTPTGFGASSTGFGGAPSGQGAGIFGGGNNNNANSTGFGGFGAANTNTGGFGAKPAFGAPATATTGTGLFGGTANTNATTNNAFGGGFGAANNNTTGGFGSTGGGMFGSTQNKPAFGAPTTTTVTGGLFGGGGTTNTTGFGQTGGGFGTGGTGFGQQAQNVNQGTAAVPFSAHTEKDSGSTANSHYQSITFMQPYQNYSFEELRVADYNAGRRFGNSNGQAGAFGQSSGFGGFGGATTNTTTGFGAANNNNTTGTGLFGNTTANTSSPFGGQTQQQGTTTSAFGGNTLFGQNKPVGTGIFGSAPAASTATTNTGLFGTANNNTNATATTGFGGFGQQNNTASAGLFGANNQNQAKPAFGGFGASTTTNAFGGTGGFGQNNNTNTGTGLFGASATNAFGGGQQNQQNQPSGGFGFGQNNQNQSNQNQQSNTLFGGAFGQNQNNQNQQKPLFGASTGTTLFGNNNNNQQQNQPSLFGNNQNQQQNTLFGAKPATGGNTLFGGANNTGTSTGIFGNNNQQNQQTTSLFGNNNNQQAKPLFGATTNNGGSTLFGGLGQQNNNAGGNAGNIFGSTQAGNNSIFGGSQQNQQQNQPSSLTASLMQNPYGNDQLFAGLGTPSQSVGPLATPLSGASKQAKRPQAIPAFKINPSASMRLITPQKRPTGYGFSYSTYGTPGSAQTFTPGRSSGLFGTGPLNKQLSKSLSTSNLRSPLAAEEGVHNANAFTPNYRPYSSGSSIRRLKIDRSLRTDLFGNDAPERATKRVSFDGTSAMANGAGQTIDAATPGPNNALVRTESESAEPSSEDLGFRSARNTNKDSRTNGAVARPEMEQARGNELAIVPEDEQVHASGQNGASKTTGKDQGDPQAGEYYMIPSLEQLRDMSRDELSNVSPFIVGRVGIGKIEFSKVDLTTVPLDQVTDNIVKLSLRSATVYDSSANTPPQGKGLNVPSMITLENSWPRSNGGRLPVHERKGPRFDKHVERLKRVGGTEFVSYSPESGEWVFKVQHFTTYGLDDDEEATIMDETEDQNVSERNGRPVTPSPGDHSVQDMDTSVMSPANSDPDDTFDFKKSGKTIPGGFGSQNLFDDEETQQPIDHEDDVSVNEVGQNTLEDPFDVGSGGRGMISPPDTDDEGAQVIGAFPEAVAPPKSILKPAAFLGTPVQGRFQFHDNWAEQLQRTVSPRKQDRKALREQQGALVEVEAGLANSVLGRPVAKHTFNTTMDIMNSLWNQSGDGNAQSRSAASKRQGPQWPLSKQSNCDPTKDQMSDIDRSFHDSFKPHWDPDGTLVHIGTGGLVRRDDGLLLKAHPSFVSETRDVHISKLHVPADKNGAVLEAQLDRESTSIRADSNGIPLAALAPDGVTFTALAGAASNDSDSTSNERNLWKLAAVLFDPLEVSCKGSIQGIPLADLPKFEVQIRRDATLALWREMTAPMGMDAARSGTSSETRAMAYLSCGNVEGACKELVEGKNFHLATIVAQMPLDESAQQTLRKQIDNWRLQNVLAEIPVTIRAIYELAAGNAGISEGKTGAAEDRAATFSISELLGLSWQQALGLRLWYGASDIALALESYLRDVADGKEKTNPAPTLAIPLDSSLTISRQDGMVALLRLFASNHSTSVAAPIAEELLSPNAISGHPFNVRPSWQLATLLSTHDVLPTGLLSTEQMDSLTLSLAHQLECVSSPSSILTATTVLSHLSNPSLRRSSITSLLNRRAPLITPSTHPFSDDPASDRALNYLTTRHVPAKWLHLARAQLASSHAQYSAQAAHLLLAQEPLAAHDVVLRHVGPAAVISRDHDDLRDLLDRFANGAGVPTWQPGGAAVYSDYVHLMDLRRDKEARGSRAATGSAAKEREKLVRRLGKGVEALMARGKVGMGLEERVAVGEMAKVVREEVAGEAAARAADGDGSENGFARQGAKYWALFGQALQVGGA